MIKKVFSLLITLVVVAKVYADSSDIELLSKNMMMIKGTIYNLDEEDCVLLTDDTIVINSIKVSPKLGEILFSITEGGNKELYKEKISEVTKNLNIQMDKSHEYIIHFNGRKIKIGESHIWFKWIMITIICLIIAVFCVRRKALMEMIFKKKNPEIASWLRGKSSLGVCLSDYKVKRKRKPIVKPIEKKTVVQSDISNDCKKLLEERWKIISKLNLEKDATLEDILNAIPSPPPIQTLPADQVLTNKIEALIKNKERIKKHYEKCSDKIPFEDRIKALFNMLNSALNSSIKEENIETKGETEKDGFVLRKLQSAGLGSVINIEKDAKLRDVLLKIMNKLGDDKKEQARGTDQEIVSKAVKSNRFTDEDRKVLLQKIVNEINLQIPYADSSKKLSDINSFSQLYQILSTKLVAPNSYEEAENKGKEIVFSMISTILGLEVCVENSDELEGLINQYFQERLQKDILSKLNGLENKEYGDIPFIIKEINDALKVAFDILVLFKELSVCRVEDIQEAMKKRDVENMKKTLKGKSELTVGIKFEDCRSSEQIVNKIVGELIKERIEKSNIQEQWKQRGAQIEEQNDIIGVAISYVVDNFKNGVYDLNEVISKGGFLKACDKDSKDSCVENENRIISSMVSFKAKADSVSLSSKSPLEAFEIAQSILSSELAKDTGVFNLVSCYYAYSRLSFMTDKAREYGIIFNRSMMSKIYMAMNKLVSDFGFQLILPTLFAERTIEGEYEDCTGSAYRDLDTLCPNSVNYKEFIANADKKDIITDIIHVGFSKKGKVEMKAKVLV